MKCTLCNSRKGKRHCPAKSVLICAQCCGEKRVVEIDCPSDCPYLASGQEYQSIKKFLDQVRRSDPADAERRFQTLHDHGYVIYDLEVAVLGFASDLSSLKDANILDSIELLVEDFRTEQKGVIYQHRHPNPIVESLARELREVLNEKMESGGELPALRLSEALKCLDWLASDVKFHLESDGDGGTYL